MQLPRNTEIGVHMRNLLYRISIQRQELPRLADTGERHHRPGGVPGCLQEGDRGKRGHEGMFPHGHGGTCQGVLCQREDEEPDSTTADGGGCKPLAAGGHSSKGLPGGTRGLSRQV